MIRRWLTLAGLTICLSACAPPAELDSGRLGSAWLVMPKDAPRGIVVLFSDVSGWKSDPGDWARALAKAGVIVVGVDTPVYLKNLAADPKDHLYLVDDVVNVSQQVQRRAGLSSYLTPAVAGLGEGGTLAELILAQALPATLLGAVSVDPAATVPLARPFSAGPPAFPHYHDDLQRDAVLSLPGFWSVGLTPNAPESGRDRAIGLKRDGMAVDIREFASTTRPAEALASLLVPHLAAAGASPRPSLPIVELPVGQPSDVMAILMSGDGGWADIDKVIAEKLQHDGVPVVGWDSLRYFWAEKTPERVAEDLGGVISTYSERWRASRVVLIGYSLGADVMPFAYNRLPPELRRRVALLALLGVEQKVTFEVTVDGWLQRGPREDALPIAPEVTRIPPNLVLCIYGAEEKRTGCPALAEHGVSTIRTEGAHHFDGDYTAIERRILEAAMAEAGAGAR